MAGVLVPTRVGGVEVLVETVPVPGSERTSGRLEEAGQRVVEAFDRAQDTITALASQLAGTLAAMGERAVRPDHVEVQFGLSFTAQGGIVVAGVGSQASLQVTLSYDRPGTEPRTDPLRADPDASPPLEPSE